MPCGEIERPSCEAHARRCRRLEVRRQRFGPSEDAANAREQLSRLERLGEIVVRPHFQADDTIDRLTARGQHDHRQVGFCAQVSTQLQAVFAGHHQVENNQIDARRVERFPHRRAVGRLRRAEAVRGEIFRQQRANFAIVIDDQDQRLRIHDVIMAGSSNRRARTCTPMYRVAQRIQVDTNAFVAGTCRYTLAAAGQAPDTSGDDDGNRARSTDFPTTRSDP